jgi:hypothetical protein
LDPPNLARRVRKSALLILVTWVPLVILALMRGHASGHWVDVPLLFDPEALSRFLIVVPLLELAHVVADKSLAVQTAHFVGSGLVAEQDRPLFETARAASVRARGSVVAEVAIAIMAIAISTTSQLFVGVDDRISSWARLEKMTTPAGWWYCLVSLPIVIFLLLRWAWVFVLWGWFLYRVSRLDLELTPTHPDRAGGLGFLGWGVASFAIVLAAVSTVLSGGIAGEILFRGSSLAALKYHLIVFVALGVIILHVPLFAFSGGLARCRYGGLLEFGALIGRHDRAFDRKWVECPSRDQERLLGSPDVSSLADIATAYEHVQRMRLIPFDEKAIVVLVAAALIPMIPLLGTAIPLTEIFTKLAELML